MNTIGKYRVSLAFGRLPDDSLITFAHTVREQLYAQAVFSAPPVTAVELEALTAAFANAKAAQPLGGKIATAHKNQHREILVDALKKLAYYVQVACDNDLALLLSSGFDSMSMNRGRAQLPRPSITRIANGLSGSSLVTTTANSNARSHEVIVAEILPDNTLGPFRPSIVSTSSRNILVPNLEPGKLYAYRSRAVGGSTGFSDWSDTIVQRAN